MWRIGGCCVKNSEIVVELGASINEQTAPDRLTVRGEQRIGGGTDTPEEADVPEDIDELAHSADDHSVLAFIPLIYRRKRNLELRLPVENCACPLKINRVPPLMINLRAQIGSTFDREMAYCSLFQPYRMRES
jgi:hypothetical protein